MASAIHVKLGYVVAIKVFHGAHNQEAQTELGLLKHLEERGCASLYGPTLPVLSSSLLEPLTWVACPLFGSSLLSHLRDHGAMNDALALAVAAQLADGLRRIHAAGVLHLDVKPANVTVPTAAASSRFCPAVAVNTSHQMVKRPTVDYSRI